MSGEKKQVLYIDDEHINLMGFRANFRRYWEIFFATSKDEAINRLNENPGIQCVLSDLKMADVDGLELLTELHQQFKDKIYLLVSGVFLNNEIEDAIKKGDIHQFIEKPYDPEQVVRIVEQLLTS